MPIRHKSKVHHYNLQLTWMGNTGSGTTAYDAYQRDFIIETDGKETLKGSADSAFLGNAALYNPEEWLLASLSSCHMLWFLHTCTDMGIIITDYRDQPKGEMIEHRDGSGEFTRVILYPKVITATEVAQTTITDLHHQAHQKCFIARSVNFEVLVQPQF